MYKRQQHALAALLQQQEKVAIYFWKEQIAFALADDTVWLLPWQKLLKEPEALAGLDVYKRQLLACYLGKILASQS